MNWSQVQKCSPSIFLDFFSIFDDLSKAKETLPKKIKKEILYLSLYHEIYRFAPKLHSIYVSIDITTNTNWNSRLVLERMSRMFSSLLDYVSDYQVGCIIQKRSLIL